jgi:hypothetical protein
MSEPRAERPGRLDPDRVTEDIAMVTELVATGVEVDGEVQVESTWVVYGHTSYDGEVVVGEYEDAGEAAAVLRAVRRLGLEDDRSVP